MGGEGEEKEIGTQTERNRDSDDWNERAKDQQRQTLTDEQKEKRNNTKNN